MKRILFGGTATLFALMLLSYAVFLYRLPPVDSLLESNADEMRGRKWTFRGEQGFWVAFPVQTDGHGVGGGSAGIKWMARKGLLPTECRLGCNFEVGWGDKLSTIEGGNWHVDRQKYCMSGRLYFHYKPVPVGTHHSVVFDHRTYVKDAAACG